MGNFGRAFTLGGLAVWFVCSALWGSGDGTTLIGLVVLAVGIPTWITQSATRRVRARRNRPVTPP